MLRPLLSIRSDGGFVSRVAVMDWFNRNAREGAFVLYLSEEILNEAQCVLLDEERRHRQRYHYPNEEAIHFVEGLRAFAHLVTDLPQIAVVIRDPNDDMVPRLNAPRLPVS
jgi:hypothetical protein